MPTPRLIGQPVSTRWLYEMGDTFSTDRAGEFDHVVVSLGTHGDTCAFPATAEGRLLDLDGFGFSLGPSRWLSLAEHEAYLADCVAAHRTGEVAFGFGWAPKVVPA